MIPATSLVQSELPKAALSERPYAVERLSKAMHEYRRDEFAYASEPAFTVQIQSVHPLMDAGHDSLGRSEVAGVARSVAGRIDSLGDAAAAVYALEQTGRDAVWSLLG